MVITLKGRRLNYFESKSTHTPGTLCEILPEIVNRHAQLITGTPKYVSQSIDYVYPDNANALHKVQLTPFIFSNIGDFCNDLN